MWGSIVGIASRLRSEGRRNQTASYSMGEGTFCSGGKVSAVMQLNTRHQLAPRLRMPYMPSWRGAYLG